jgi:hypothetical protein
MICKWNKVRCIDMNEYDYEDKDDFVTCMTNSFQGVAIHQPALAPLT